MPPTKLEQLVYRVYESTGSGKIAWQKTENEDVFQTALPNYALRITSISRGANSYDYTITIYNQEGAIIEDITDTEIDEAEAGYDPYEVMSELYDRARGQAMGIDKAIDDILGYLGE